jgi:hypothetical protein
MLLAWLLPEAVPPVLVEGWTRSAYQPRHVKPPLIVRTCRLITERRSESAAAGHANLVYEIGRVRG